MDETTRNKLRDVERAERAEAGAMQALRQMTGNELLAMQCVAPLRSFSDAGGWTRPRDVAMVQAMLTAVLDALQGRSAVTDLRFRCGYCGEDCPGEPESCWYCTGPLCFRCWDRFGHCGHPEADKINEEARSR